LLFLVSTDSFQARIFAVGCILAACFFASSKAHATPANKTALAGHFEHLLPARLNDCITCHQHPGVESPQSLDDIPHNLFGDRLRQLGKELKAQKKDATLPVRLSLVSHEDADADGIANLTELLLGTNPGIAEEKPEAALLATASAKLLAYEKFQSRYPWRPFQPVRRPSLPEIVNHQPSGARQTAEGSPKGEAGGPNQSTIINGIDSILGAAMEDRGLTPRPEADRATLLRRVYLDLIGLAPTPEELRAFLADPSPLAYEKVVDRLLDDPRHGERWARHWMDIWRYSDWAGYKDMIRFSQPHIWHWRDWIVESLNADKGYDRMVVEMLAADEAEPENLDALRATGFLARNYEAERGQWMDAVIEHTGKAFLGITMNCAKCHDHKFDPISQHEYFAMRAIFEGHNIRTEPLPGELDTAKDGLVRAFDASLNPGTFLLERGDDRFPVKDKPIEPGVPAALGGALDVRLVKLPATAATPEKREYVRTALLKNAQAAVEKAAQACATATDAEKSLKLEASKASLHTLQAMLPLEKMEERGVAKSSPQWKSMSEVAAAAQLESNLLEAKVALAEANDALAIQIAKQKGAKGTPAKNQAQRAVDGANAKVASAAKALAAAEKAKASGAPFRPRPVKTYPDSSSGRRLAFAKWLTDPQNPLTARVAANHIWLRHFGRGLVETPSDFGANGRKPAHPALLDWLAAELMQSGWSMRHLHRLIVTSAAYRRSGTTDAADAKLDPDNVCYWKMPSRRMEGEVVRDNLLWVSGALDVTTGGPDIDNTLAESSHRRSLYLRHAQEKTVEFIQIFDGPAPNECYQRETSVKPHQALALMNSKLANDAAQALEAKLSAGTGADYSRFIEEAFLTVLSRPPTPQEVTLCSEFLDRGSPDAARARRNLLGVLLNHNDFVTIR
jgi:hypothetical protein